LSITQHATGFSLVVEGVRKVLTMTHFVGDCAKYLLCFVSTANTPNQELTFTSTDLLR